MVAKRSLILVPVVSKADVTVMVSQRSAELGYSGQGILSQGIYSDQFLSCREYYNYDTWKCSQTSRTFIA